MKNEAIILKCLLLSFLLFLTGFSEVINVKNSSFEEGNGYPHFWFSYKSSGTEASFNWDNTVSHTGKYSVYIKNNGPKNAVWQTSVPVKGSVTYLIKVWAKVKNGKGITKIGLRCEDTTGNWVGQIFEGKGISGDKDWTEISLEVKVPNDAIKARIFLMNSGGSGDEVWFDDVSMEEK